MKGARVKVQSAYTIAAAIMDFYETAHLFPRGVHKAMQCVQDWALKMGGAIKKMVNCGGFSVRC